MKLPNFIFLITLLTTIILQAQEASLDWVKTMGGTLGDKGQSVTVDVFGNIYTTGSFSGTADFDPGDAVFNLTTSGGFDVFVQKLAPNGDFLWAKSLGGTNTDIGQSIITDAAGNVYVTGYFRNSADFDPGAATFSLTSNGASDIFIQKLDAEGDFIWAKSIGNTGNDSAFTLAIDNMANIYMIGYYRGTVDFDPNVPVFNLTSNGQSDVFILKLDNDGEFLWAKSLGGTEADIAFGITTDIMGSVYVTGGYKGTVDFDPGTAVFDLTSVGNSDVFVLKTTADGDFLWAKSMGGIAAERGRSITTDTLGNVYLTGEFEETVDFDPNSTIVNLTSNGDRDVFIQCLSTNGILKWVKSMGGIGKELGYAITNDELGNIYVAGEFEETIDFDPGVGIFNIVSNGSNDIYIQNLNLNGDFVWATSIGSAGPGDTAQSMTTDAEGNIYITGGFRFFTDFDPGSGTVNVIPQGGDDVFVLKLVHGAVGTNEQSLFNDVSIFPNPSDGQMTIDLVGLKKVSIKIFSLNGQLVYFKENITSQKHTFFLDAVSGFYFMELSTEEGRAWFKLIRE